MDNLPGPSGSQDIKPESSVSSGKVKKPRLSYEQKIQIFTLLDLGVKQSEVAKKFNVSQAAVTYLKRNKENLKKNTEILEKEHIGLNRKRFSSVITSDREQKLMQWLTQKQAEGAPISGKIIREAAIIFNEHCNGPGSFKACNGFLHRFQKRRSMLSLSTQEERLSSDSDGAAEFKDHLTSYINDLEYGLDQIYNAAESGLLWKDLPGRTLIDSSKNSAPEWKLQKDRVTIMVCSNADGSHKLPLFMIGKSANPHCLQGLNKELLPVMYMSQPNAWMDKDVFMDWYTHLFLPQINDKYQVTGKKCILILDNAPTHPHAEILNSISDICSVIYQPPNVTSLMQPMNQGVIEKFKRSYRANLLRALIKMDNERPVQTFQKEMNIYKCIMFAAEAWNNLTPSDLANAWRMTLGQPLETILHEADDADDVGRDVVQIVPEFANLTTDDVAAWFQHDNIYPGREEVTLEEMEHDKSPKYEEDNDDDDQLNEAASAPPNAGEASTSGELFLKWCYSRWDFSQEQLTMLQSMVEMSNKVTYDDKFLRR